MDKKAKQIYSWALYDWANSAFATTVLAGFFPVFFKSYWADSIGSSQSTFYLGAANSIASVMIALFAPVLGAAADRGSLKKKFLLFFALMGITLTGSMALVQQGQWLIAIIVYIVAYIGFAGGNVFYDSMLGNVSSNENSDFVSSLGYALGYIGGGLLFLTNVLMFKYPVFFGIDSGVSAVKISFFSVAAWWAVFSIPILVFVKEAKPSAGIMPSIRTGWSDLVQTLREIKKYRNITLFLLAYWLYIDGVDTIILMAVDYGMYLGLPPDSLIAALLIVQFIAFPSALFYSWIAYKINTYRAIMVAIFAYALITFFAFFMKTQVHFYLLAVSVALFQGGIQALSRSYYSKMIPREKSAQFFGFYNMIGKFAAVIGPLLLGTVTLISGHARYGALSIIVLFVSGFFLLKYSKAG